MKPQSSWWQSCLQSWFLALPLVFPPPQFIGPKMASSCFPEEMATEFSLQVMCCRKPVLSGTSISDVLQKCKQSPKDALSNGLEWNEGFCKEAPVPRGCSVCCGALCAPGAVEIPSAQLAHGGRYTCVARNAAGSAHRHVTLHVQGKLEAEEQGCSGSQHCCFSLLRLYNFSAFCVFLTLNVTLFPFFFIPQSRLLSRPSRGRWMSSWTIPLCCPVRPRALLSPWSHGRRRASTSSPQVSSQSLDPACSCDTDTHFLFWNLGFSSPFF